MENQESIELVSMDSYDIRIGYDLLQFLPTYVKTLTPSSDKYLLITDETLFNLYARQMIDNFKKNGIDLLYYTVQPGEHSKSRQQKCEIEDFMFENNCNIDTVIIAFGGGVIGDLAGFIASTYMRGINYIQVPTSCISMIDSSIGAKTGINVEKYGKNLLGCFYRPKGVFIDIRLLDTLSTRDLSNGMAEAIKIALTCDEDLFYFIETNLNQILNKDSQILTKLIYECIKLKANIVKQDEKETSGLRSILNFGHSIGHSIEILVNGKLLHGECVSIGMILESELSRNKHFLLNSDSVISRLTNLLKSFHLPITIPSYLSFKDIIQKMSIDKKNRNGKKHIVILTNIGSVKTSPRYTTPIDDEDLINLLDTNISLTQTINSNTIPIDVPGSKSISNRVLLLSALGIGECRIHGLLYSIDTQTMLICLRQLGVNYYWDKDDVLVIDGKGGKLNLTGSSTLYLNNSGTSSRFLTTLCTILPDQTEIILTGDERLKERPIKDLTDVLIQNQNNIIYLNSHGCLPIKILSNGTFKGGEIHINGDVSSQFVTSLLLISPFASTSLNLKLNLNRPIVSKPYIDMTINLMKTQFGIEIDDTQLYSYLIPNCGPYNNPTNIEIEGDASSASYFLGICAVHPHLSVTLSNIGYNSLQGDSQFCRILELMGCHVIQTETTTTLTAPQQLIAISHDIDMNTMTDTFMTLACVAAFAQGRTKIINISNQRLKECNRIQAMVTELQKCGINATETETGLDIEGNNNQNITKSSLIHCYDDHRIAMSFSIIASRAKNLIIDDKRCVDKTYPQFWIDLDKVFNLKAVSPTLVSSDILTINKSNKNHFIF
jgi:pentafunctional AROM polypeptide